MQRKENILSVPGIEPEFLGHPTCSLVTEPPEGFLRILSQYFPSYYNRLRQDKIKKNIVSTKTLFPEGYMKLDDGT
jgi:hypothetical protein